MGYQRFNERKRGSFPYAKQPIANQFTSFDYHNTKAKCFFSAFLAQFLHGLVWFALQKGSNLGWASRIGWNPSVVLQLTPNSPCSSASPSAPRAGTGTLNWLGQGCCSTTGAQWQFTKRTGQSVIRWQGRTIQGVLLIQPLQSINHVLSNEVLQVESAVAALLSIFTCRCPLQTLQGSECFGFGNILNFWLFYRSLGFS